MNDVLYIIIYYFTHQLLLIHNCINNLQKQINYVKIKKLNYLIKVIIDNLIILKKKYINYLVL